MSDAVEKPPHYNTGDIECITAIQASMSLIEFQGYCKGNCFKSLEDLKKARWYLDKLIDTHQEISSS